MRKILAINTLQGEVNYNLKAYIENKTIKFIIKLIIYKVITYK